MTRTFTPYTQGRKLSILFFICFLLVIKSYAQSYKPYLPYKHQGLWGIVDTSQSVLLEAKHKKIRYIGDMDYVELDGHTLIDLSTGKQLPSPGNYSGQTQIGSEDYYIFNTEGTTTMVNVKSKDTIRVSTGKSKYNRLSSFQLKDPKTSQSQGYFLTSETTKTPYTISDVFLKQDVSLTKILSMDENSYVVAELKQTRNDIAIALVTKDNKLFKVYNHQLQLVKTFPHNQGYKLNQAQLDELKAILQVSDLNWYVASIDETSVFDGSWKIQENQGFPNAIQQDENNKKYYVLFKTSETEKKYLKPSSFILYTGVKVKTMYSKKMVIIVDKRYVKPGKLIFPKGVLIEK